MHTCPPPTAILENWLLSNGTITENYGHLLLVQQSEIDQDLIDALKPYFESAHLDAREYFHDQVGISLHPDADADAPPVDYPKCLPDRAKRGLFGEVVAGLMTEAYKAEFVGNHDWKVPIFLFRYHDDVEKYLWALKFDSKRTREIYGRHGSDFIAIALTDDGELARVIAGEAKWRASLTAAVVDSLMLGPKEKPDKDSEAVHNGKGIWFEVNRDSPIPQGLRQLQKLLEHRDPDGHASAILSIDRAVYQQVPPPDRTNLILIVGNGAKRRESMDVLIGWEEAPKEYTAPHDLQVVEVILSGGEDLIDGLYNSLWQGG